MESQFSIASELIRMTGYQESIYVIYIVMNRVVPDKNISFVIKSTQTIHIIKLLLTNPNTGIEYEKYVHFDSLQELDAFKKDVENPQHNRLIIPWNLHQKFFHYDLDSITFSSETSCYHLNSSHSNIANCEKGDSAIDFKIRQNMRDTKLFEARMQLNLIQRQKTEIIDNFQSFKKTSNEANKKNQKLIEQLKKELEQKRLSTYIDEDEDNFNDSTHHHQLPHHSSQIFKRPSPQVKKLKLQIFHLQNDLEEQKRLFKRLRQSFNSQTADTIRAQNPNCNLFLGPRP